MEKNVFKLIVGNDAGDDQPRLGYEITARGIVWTGLPELPRARAARFYRHALACGQRREVADLDAEARDAGLSANAIRVGKKDAGVVVDGHRLASIPAGQAEDAGDE